MEVVHLVIALLFGLVVGSFLNVVVWRLPRGENLSKPRSHCPGCGVLIRWFDNIPVVSWLLLRAKCRGCGTHISGRYPFVELLTGVLFALAWLQHGDHLTTTILASVFLAAMVAISFIDIDHRIIPDRISKPGIVFFIALAPLSLLHLTQPPFVASVKPALSAWLHAGAGAAVGIGVILVIRSVGSWILKKEAMGLGDAKLLGLIGAAVGPIHALYSLALACLGGAVIGSILFAVGKRRPMPCALTTSGGGVDASFDRMRVRDDHLEVTGAPELAAGTDLALDLVLPAVRVLEEEDPRLVMRGRLAAVEGSGDARIWRIEVLEPTEDDIERLSFFGQSYRYIPFGPFLALGGTLAVLYGEQVHWWITVGYPQWAQGVIGR